MNNNFVTYSDLKCPSVELKCILDDLFSNLSVKFTANPDGTVTVKQEGVTKYTIPKIQEINYGAYEITAVASQLEYLIPFTTTTIGSFQLTEVENSVGGGYYANYIAKVSVGSGILVKYATQPTVGQKVKFNYLVIK